MRLDWLMGLLKIWWILLVLLVWNFSEDALPFAVFV